MLLNFNTGIVHHGVLHMNRKDIALHYLETWFFIDFLANFPFEYVLGGDFEKQHRKSVKLLKWTKLPKLLRLGRILKYLKKYMKYAEITKLTFLFIFSIHFLGCLWISLEFSYQACAQSTLQIST